MKQALTLRNALVAGLLIFLAALPIYSMLSGNVFVLTLFTRIVILAIAAVGLNLIIGFGGMVSFGHAVYLGVGRLRDRHPGIREGCLPASSNGLSRLLACALFALFTGALSLRTRGVYFIMITLALFADDLLCRRRPSNATARMTA